MPRFNSIKFYQNRPKTKLVFVKKAPPLQISGYAPESNHAFAQLIFMPPEFFLKPDFKGINFYQNKAKIKLFWQKKKKAVSAAPARFPTSNRCCTGGGGRVLLLFN